MSNNAVMTGESHPPDSAGSNRRSQTRLHCDPARVLLELTGEPLPVEAQVIDVSTSGLQLRLGKSVSVGKLLHVIIDGMIISGRICRCRPDETGSFEVGVAILDVQHTRY